MPLERLKLTVSLRRRGPVGLLVFPGQRARENSAIFCGDFYFGRSRLMSDIQVRHIQRILDDKIPAWLDHITHQRRKDLVCGDGVLNLDLQ
jgi:hypothetical protein